MKVYEIRDISRAWVEEQFADRPEFVGAHLMGGINELPPEAEFPTYSDVDMSVVIEGEGTRWPSDMHHRGLMLEYGFESADDYRSVETLITNPSLAPNLVMDSILVDPQQVLTKAHAFIAKAFKRRRWVQARCDDEKRNRIEPYIAAMDPNDVGANLWFTCTALAGYLAVATLQRPTHRKALIRSRNILEAKQALHLQDALLDLYGCAAWDKVQVKNCLQGAMAAFDLAVQIHQTPHIGDFKLKPYLRPYFADATQAMIDAGDHREAVPWIMVTYAISALTISADGSDDEREQFVNNGFRPALSQLGLTSAADWADRANRARQVADSIYQFCDDIIAAYPD